MTTEISSRSLQRKHAQLMVAVLFAAGILILVLFSSGQATAPKPSGGESAAAPPPQAAPETVDVRARPVAGAESPSATSGQRFAIAGTVPLHDEVLTDRIVIIFNEPITVAGLDEEGAMPPFTMNVPFDGEFYVGPNYLDIHSSEFPRDQLLLVDLSDAIRSASGKLLPPKDRHLTFAPFAFKAQQVWSLESTPDREVLGASFPTPVALDALREDTRILTLDGQQVPFTVEEGTSAGIYRLVVEGNASWPVSVQFSKGLKDASGTLELAEDESFTYPTEMDLAVRQVAWHQISDEEQGILLEFSKPVSSLDLKEHLTVQNGETGDSIAFSVVPDLIDLNQVITVRLARPTETPLLLEFASGLPGAEHSVLAQSIKRRLPARAEQEKRPLMFTDQWWGREEREGLVLNLGFSQKVEASELTKHLHISPKVPDLRIEPGWNSERVKVYGQWRSETAYEVVVTSGLIYNDGATLGKDISRRITSERVPAYVGFGQEGKYYFPRRTGLALPMEVRGVQKVRVRLHRMFPSNIAVAVRDINDGKPWHQFIDSWSQFVTSTDMDVPFSPNQLATTPVNLDSFIPQDKLGVFCVEVQDISTRQPNDSDEEEYDYYGGASTQTKLVLFTNIGLLSHWLNDELVIFAHNLYSLEPLSLAKVTVYSRKNQVLGTANTDAQGMAHLGAFDTSLGLPAVVVVEKDGDYTFLELEPRSDDIREATPEMPPFDRDAYDAFLYADRELYRPGETIHLRWIVRTNYGDALAEVPLVLTVTKPNGQDLLNEPTTLSTLGTGGTDIVTQKAYPTGKYTATLKVPGTNRALGTYQFSLEEFVPNRIKAEVAVDEPYWMAGQDYTVTVNAQHFFGAPASERKCEMKVVLRPASFAPDAWKAYSFGNDSTFKTDIVSSGEETTDSQGNASFPFKYEAPPTATSPLSALVIGRVFELGGRAVAGTKELTLFPSDTCLGITANTPDGGRGVEVNVAAIHPDGTPAVLGSVKVTLEKQVWNYYVRRYYDYHQSNWSESFDALETRDVPLTDGKGSVTFTFGNYGYYRVRVHSDATPQYSTLSFYSYGGQVNLVNAARPSLIKLTTDKEKYTIGDEAVVRVEAPFDGKGFIVLQGETIQRIETVDIKDGVGSARFMMTPAQCPNVWVEATVVHAIQEGRDQVYPFSSYAMQSVRVEDPRRTVAVTFTNLPEEIVPAKPARFDIETRDGQGNPASVEVTLAAVDEGIHAITGYQSPDPVGYLSRPRRADFRRAHYYDKVAYDFEKSPIGGDLEALLGKRAAAVDENWIHPVALWSGVVRTDADGRATVTMDVPEFSGQLRLVAVAASPAATGAQTGYVYVRRPHTLRTSMPRFLLPGDKAVCRAVLFNNTDTPCKAVVSWTVEGTLAPSTGTQDVEVPAHGEASLQADFGAAEAIGQGQIQWSAVFQDNAGNELERLAERAPVPVRMPAAYQSHHELTILKPGESVTVRNTEFLDDSRADVDVTVSANPELRLQEALKYVVGYPYGCVEQTTSRLMPMYLLKQSAPLTGLVLKKEQRLDTYIQAGIDRLFSMQTETGGLGFWPGAHNPYRYGSVYALHFLTLVKNGRDYPLPEENFRALQKYVRGLIDDATQNNLSNLYTRAYAIYVLALDGDLKAIQQIRRFDDVSLPRAARYLLAAALARNTQDQDRVKMYLAKAPSEPYTVHESFGTLNSDIRNTAVELLALQQMNGDPNAMAEKADALMAYLQSHRYGNTQETAFIISALSGYLAGFAANADKAAATVNGPGGEVKVSGATVYHDSQSGPGRVYTVTNTGQTPLFVNGTTGGIPKVVKTEPVTEGLSVRRVMYTGGGEPFEGGAYQQAASYVIGVELSCDQAVKNLVVADLIPAGFEIENPRLEPDAIPTGPFEGAATPSYLEIRDDRLVVAFDELSAGPHRFYYVVRAVTPGTFQYPAVEAECMYDASVRGRGEVGTIEIAGR